MVILLAAILLHPLAAITSLPQAIPMPSKSLTESAQILAQQISKHDASSGPALMTALAACGFTILDKKRLAVAVPLNGKGMGLALEEYEVLGILNAKPKQPKFPFMSLCQTLSVICGKDQEQSIHSAIIDSLRKAMNSNVPEVRFYANFINDLSIYGEDSWNLNDGSDGTGTASPIAASSGLASGIKPVEGVGNKVGQMTNFLQFKTMELMTEKQSVKSDEAKADKISKQEDVVSSSLEKFQERQSQQMMALVNQPYAYGNKPLTMLQHLLLTRRLYADLYVGAKLAMAPQVVASISPDAMSLDDQDPNAGRDYTGNAVDFGGMAASTTFQVGVYGQLGAKGFNDAIGNAATLGAYSKLIMSYLNLEVEITPDSLPLERRKDKKAGEPNTLTFKMKLNTDKVENGAAKRGSLWAFGIDIPIPDNGPVQGANVSWSLEEAEAPLLDWATQWCSPKGKERQAFKLNTQTDKQGQAEIGIQTTPQRSELPANCESYSRVAKVYVAANLKGNNLIQDMVDAIGVAVSGATGGILGAIKAALPEMMYRTTILSSTETSLKVKDWTPPSYEGNFELEITGEKKETDGQWSRNWSVAHKLHGKLVSLLAGYPQLQISMRKGDGPYAAVLRDVKDATINDVAHSSGPGGDCGSAEKFYVHNETATGPVDSGKEVQGGSLMNSVRQQAGGFVRTVQGRINFQLSSQVNVTETEKAPMNAVLQIPIGMEFTSTSKASGDGSAFSGTETKDVDVEIIGLKGKLHCKFTYLISPVKKKPQ